MNASNSQGSLLTRISDGITARAAHLHRLELSRFSRRTQAAIQFQGMITNLKFQLAQKAALRVGASCAAERLEPQIAAVAA